MPSDLLDRRAVYARRGRRVNHRNRLAASRDKRRSDGRCRRVDVRLKAARVHGAVVPSRACNRSLAGCNERLMGPSPVQRLASSAHRSSRPRDRTTARCSNLGAQPGSRLRCPAHHHARRPGGGLRGRGRGNLEPGAAEHAGRARVDRRGRDPGAARVDRVALEDGRAVLGRVVDGGVEQRARDARSPRRLRDDEAVDRPTRRRPPAGGSSATWATARTPRAAPARPSRPPCRRRRSPPGPEPGRSRRRARGGLPVLVDGRVAPVRSRLAPELAPAPLAV